MKSYTAIEQSRKLAELLPLESADMCLTYVNNVWNPVWGKADDIYQLQKDCYEPDYTKDDYVDIDKFEPKVVPCWSLVALINVLPSVTLDSSDDHHFRLRCMEKFTEWHDNAIDTCVEMIEKLHKQMIYDFNNS